MKFQAGDRVRYLNEAIEGTVVRTLPNNRVEVATADGFTATAFGHELVRVEFEIGMAGYAPIPSNETRLEPAPQEPAPIPTAKTVSILDSLDPDDTVYAAVILADELSPLTTDIELILVNNTNQSVSFVCSRKQADVLELCLAATLPARAEKKIGMYSQDELHTWEGFHFSMLFFHPGIYKPLPPFEKTLHIESNQFLDVRLWEKAGGSGNRVLLNPLKSLKIIPGVQLDKLLDKFAPTVSETTKKETVTTRQGKSKSQQRYVILAKEKVVDLHIEELVKDFSGMNNAQIISHQINFFLKELDRALIDKLHKITFIHGVGQGVLKSAIREELKKYEHIRFGDGPPEKYGYGATEVIFD